MPTTQWVLLSLLQLPIVVCKIGQHFEIGLSTTFAIPAIHCGGVTCSALAHYLFKGFRSSLPRLIRWAAN
jgi:hypothetical protein